MKNLIGGLVLMVIVIGMIGAILLCEPETSSLVSVRLAAFSVIGADVNEVHERAVRRAKIQFLKKHPLKTFMLGVGVEASPEDMILMKREYNRQINICLTNML